MSTPTKDTRTAGAEPKIVASPSEVPAHEVPLMMSAASAIGPEPDAERDLREATAEALRIKSGGDFAMAIGQLQTNHWVRPPGYESRDWIFIRLLPKNHHNERVRAQQAQLEADLKMQGWKDAPKGTRYIGYETDGEHRRWLYIHKSVKMAQDDRRRAELAARAAKKKDPLDQYASDMTGIRGVTVTELRADRISRR